MLRRSTLFLYIVLAAAAQTNPYGRITGRVMDSAGALVPNTAIRVVNVETNVATLGASNAEGNFEVLNLNPGAYKILAEAAGFKHYERGPIEVRVGDVLNIEIQLELGAVTETVNVTAEAPLLESASANVGQVIDNRRIQDLPLAGGNPMYLTQLTPGVLPTNPPTHGWLPHAVDSISNVASAGARNSANEFTLDGIPNVTQEGQVSFAPPPEMVQEFRVQTAAFDASIGHFTGSHVNMVLRSGTNDFHGSAYFGHVSRPLMTKPFFTNRSIYDTRSGPVTPEKINSLWPYTKTNRYRANVGGPVYIPRLYNGRNRTFWMYGFDNLDRIRPESAYFTVPTAAERAGNFSELLRVGSQYQIYDPNTIALAPGGRTSRQIFPGNIIPASRFDPMAQKLLGYFPLPNEAGTVDGRNNYSDPKPRRIDYHSQILRVDQVFNERHRLYGSLSWSYLLESWGNAFHNQSTGMARNRKHRGFALDDVVTLRPDLILNLRYGLTRFLLHDRPTSVGFDLASLGFPSSFTRLLDGNNTSFPEIVIDGYATLGSDTGFKTLTNYHTVSGTLSHVRGNHSLRAGGEYRALQENNYNWGYVGPRIEFGSAWTRGPADNSTAAPIGQGLASFLLGRATGGYIDRNASYAEQSGYMGYFVHDDWKLTRKLTLNLGVRWEVEFPTTERYNRTNRGFDFTTPNPIQAAATKAYAASPIPEVPVAQFRTTGGLLFSGVNGQPRGLWNTQTRNFAPRVGLAYALGTATVLRAGYGIFYDSIGADRVDVYQQGFSQRTSLTPSLDQGLTFRATLANPFPDGLLEPAGASAGLLTFLGRSPGFATPTRRNGYMQRWMLDVQHELPHRVLVDVGYVGNRGTRLGMGEDLNATPARYLSTSPVRDQATIDYLSAAVANPFFGMPEFAGSNLQGRTVGRNQLLRPFPQFAGLSTTLDAGISWYHSLQVRAEKRFSHGYTLQASYTWSKFMEAIEKLNPTDPHPHHVISPQDRPQRIVLSGIYELPFGRKRRFLSQSGKFINGVFGGWSVQGIYQGQSGPPLGFGNILFYGGDIHDIVLPRGERTVERWFNTDAGFEKDSRKALGSNIRTFPLRLTGLRQDGYNNLDLSVFKNFTIREGLRFQLRGEAQDSLNHAMFAAPNLAPANTLFGSVNGIVGTEQRRITIAGKLSW
ncbi:MAG: carboxypeptidase-like regulatory domain-containing protein [Bryobacteraceae bacterium]